MQLLVESGQKCDDPDTNVKIHDVKQGIDEMGFPHHLRSRV